jgi:predicted ABC-type ATPase
MMLRRIDELIQSRANFVVETTLATLTYARKIPDWQAKGYIVSLIYLRLRTIEDSIARVHKRIAAGGHSIPEGTIRRRFGRSFNYFETVYKSIVNEWYVWDSREGDFVLANAWNRTGP